jgi:hypothetical protein
MNTICEIKNLSIREQKKIIGIKNDYYVYHLIDPRTNIPFYVGKGRYNRMYRHEKNVLNNRIPNKNNHLFHKIKKILTECGYIKYSKILENADEKIAYLKEAEEIKRIGRTNLKTGPLCNLTEGGDGSKFISEELERKRREKLRKIGYTRKHTDEERRKMSLANKGHGFSPETLLKMSLKKLGMTSKFKGIPRTKEIKEKLSESNDFRKKKIYQFDNNNNIIKMWNGISEASRTLNIQKSNIIKCLKNKVLTCGGYKWKYV